MSIYLIFPIAILIPGAIGYLLGWRQPHRKPIKNALIAAAPLALAFFGFAGWITLTEDMTCEPQPCESMAPVWAIAMYVMGVVTFVTGIGVGLIADNYARKRAEERAEKGEG